MKPKSRPRPVRGAAALVYDLRPPPSIVRSKQRTQKVAESRVNLLQLAVIEAIDPVWCPLSGAGILGAVPCQARSQLLGEAGRERRVNLFRLETPLGPGLVLLEVGEVMNVGLCHVDWDEVYECLGGVVFGVRYGWVGATAQMWDIPLPNPWEPRRTPCRAAATGADQSAEYPDRGRQRIG